MAHLSHQSQGTPTQQFSQSHLVAPNASHSPAPRPSGLRTPSHPKGTSTTSKYTSVHIHRDEVPAKIEFHLPRQCKYPLVETYTDSAYQRPAPHTNAVTPLATQQQVLRRRIPTVDAHKQLVQLTTARKFRPTIQRIYLIIASLPTRV